MKFCAIIVTRGRPRQAIGVIEAARVMASGDHGLEFIVACDDDDPADTAGILSAYGDPSIKIECGPRPQGVGAAWNRCVGLTDADVILTMPDDCILATAMWDKVAAQCFEQFPWVHPDIAIAALNDTANPGQATLFMFRPSWFRHCGLFDDRFPFWFADTAICETYAFITGRNIPHLPILAANKPGNNPRLRDMALWWRLFAATRKERVEKAQRVRAALGLPEPDIAGMLANCAKRDAIGLPNSVDVAANLPNPAPIDDAYRAAKAAAERYLARPIPLDDARR